MASAGGAGESEALREKLDTARRQRLLNQKLSGKSLGEQLGGEELDLPVFFYLDPAFAHDPQMAGVDSLTLSYTFFQVQEDEVEEALRAALAQSPHAAPAHA